MKIQESETLARQRLPQPFSGLPTDFPKAQGKQTRTIKRRRSKGWAYQMSPLFQWGMGWVVVGTAVFGAPRIFDQNPGKYIIFPQKDAKSGRPKKLPFPPPPIPSPTWRPLIFKRREGVPKAWVQSVYWDLMGTCASQRSSSRLWGATFERVGDNIGGYEKLGAHSGTPCPSDNLYHTLFWQNQHSGPNSEKQKKNSCPLNFCLRFWGQKWLHQFYRRLEKFRSSCRKTSMPITFLVLGGGVSGFFWGGKCRFWIFLFLSLTVTLDSTQTPFAKPPFCWFLRILPESCGMTKTLIVLCGQDPQGQRAPKCLKTMVFSGKGFPSEGDCLNHRMRSGIWRTPFRRIVGRTKGLQTVVSRWRFVRRSSSPARFSNPIVYLALTFLTFFQEWPRQTKPKKGQFMNFSQGHSGTKVQCESCLFSQGKTPEFTIMGEIHELFVLALFWFGLTGPLLILNLMYTSASPRI